MSKALIEEVRQQCVLVDSDDQARTIIKTVLDGIVAVTAREEKVSIRGFGTFQRKLRAARTARNPKTGEPIRVSERTRLTFVDRTQG